MYQISQSDCLHFNACEEYLHMYISCHLMLFYELQIASPSRLVHIYASKYFKETTRTLFQAKECNQEATEVHIRTSFIHRLSVSVSTMNQMCKI